MSRRSSRKANRNRPQKDRDYDRNDGRLGSSSVGYEPSGRRRQLFDPFSDNPIAFNKVNEAERNTASQMSGQRSYLAQYQEKALLRRNSSDLRKAADRIDDDGDMMYAPRGPATGRLWSADDDRKSSTNKRASSNTSVPVVQSPSDRRAKNVSTVPREKPQDGKPSSKGKPDVKDQHKKKLRQLLADIQAIEKRIAALNSKASELAFFEDPTAAQEQPRYLRSSSGSDRDIEFDEKPRGLTAVDLELASKLWRDKIDLHISLADKYMEVICFDYAFSEKKSLESLCWKRAIYSVVDQFRNALKVRTDVVDETEEEENDEGETEGEDASDDEVPVITENGMTMTKMSEAYHGDIAGEADQHVTKAEELGMLRTLFGEFLDRADDFYRRFALALRELDKAEFDGDDASFDLSMKQYLQEWRRTKRFKWYRCIPYRGDIARYRLTYAVNPGSTCDQQQALKTAWTWYALAIWLMPATGKLYFHLSLVINSSTSIQPCNVLFDLHKLYFSTRSLMVRRNGFLNAREGMVVLFESNRRWVVKYLERLRQQRKKKHKLKQKDDEFSVRKEDAVAALFIRLHGMLFTKIGLDQFAEVKRRLFDRLFPGAAKEESLGDDRFTEDHSGNCERTLSGKEMFWLEAIILCLSALYSYDYSSSKVSKLFSLNNKRLFAQQSLSANGPNVPNAADENNVDQKTNSRTTKGDTYESLLAEVKESVIFDYSIDLACLIAMRLFRLYAERENVSICAPCLPQLPDVSVNLYDIQKFAFEQQATAYEIDKYKESSGREEHKEAQEHGDCSAWMIYIEILLQWMVVSCICLRPVEGAIDLDDHGYRSSLWEALIGSITAEANGQKEISFKVAPAFWSLLVDFLNKLLGSLPEEVKYDLINRHLLDDDIDVGDTNGEISKSTTQGPAEAMFVRSVMKVLGTRPVLPEEMYLRGLGWIDDITGKLPNTGAQFDSAKDSRHDDLTPESLVLKRKIKILDYGFTLAKQMDYVIYYDPVMEAFTFHETFSEQLSSESVSTAPTDNSMDEVVPANPEDEECVMPAEDQLAPTLQAMDDAVLFANENDSVDEDEDDDVLTQLKKRREQLHALLVNTNEENQLGYRRVPGRPKEREMRLCRLRERVIPGQTTLVLDTNCFIGHFDHVKRLINGDKWPIVIPLVVVTELDGLKGNAPPLGGIAGEALRFIEEKLATKQQRNNSIRIQTSHNNFMHDISIRSEQFIFGKTDKNLDDLVLSACLWWAQQPERDEHAQHARVCLITGDRNLSVKARARDIEVMSVSAVMQLTPRK